MSGAAEHLSATLARHVVATHYTDLSAATILATKHAILDGIGVMLAASGSSDDPKPFVALARLSGGPAQATLLGRQERVNAPMAALANGALAHALDFEDAFDPAPLHPNASLLPAALAIAELQSPVSGQDFITAVAIGCDLVCRMGLSLRRSLESGGWYPPPILGAFGATFAAAKLHRLNETEVCDALSLLLCQNSCPGEIKYSPDTVIRAIREAFPAQAAVTSVLLAAGGVRGFEHPLEGRSGFYSLFAGGEYEPCDLLESLGRSYWIEKLSFKKWPACRGTHAFIEPAQLLRDQDGFEVAGIEQLVLTGGATQQMLCEPRAQKLAPRTMIDAKFSLPFVTAAALIHEEITLGTFTAAGLAERRVLDLASKAVFRLAPEFAGNGAGGALTLVMRDGRQLRHQVFEALGGPSRPLGTTDLRDKFVDCVGRAAVPLEPAQANRLADRILALEAETDAGCCLTSR